MTYLYQSWNKASNKPSQENLIVMLKKTYQEQELVRMHAFQEIGKTTLGTNLKKSKEGIIPWKDTTDCTTNRTTNTIV
jgi:hypothetical protein